VVADRATLTKAASFWSLVTRSACRISRVAISTPNKSSASSTAVAVRLRTVATNVAVRRAGGALGQHRGLGGQPVAGQGLDAVGRDGGHIDRAGADPGQLRGAVQRAGHLPAGDPDRPAPQPL
jgi:hypothetical protein